jgi:iron complex transport system substrate-binding protein
LDAIRALRLHPRLGRSAAVLATILALAGCSAGVSPATSVTPSAPVATLSPAPPSPALTPSPSPAFPVALTDDDKTAVAIAARPSKIVSLTPAATEILFAIGAGDRVAAKVEDVANYPPEASKLPVVATYKGVDIEKIVGLGADLVIAGGSGFTPADAITKLRSLGVPVLVLDATSLAGALHDIELVGDAAGDGGPARDLTASMQAQIDQLSAATRDLPKPTVFYEIGADPQIYTAPTDSIYADMLKLAGSSPITTGSDYVIPLEKIVAANPTVILLGDAAYGVTVDQVRKRAGWAGIAAVKSKAIRPVDDIVITRPGPRLVDGLRDLIVAIHPDLVLPPETSPLASAAPS